MATKEEIRPIYAELRGYLQEAPDAKVYGESGVSVIPLKNLSLFCGFSLRAFRGQALFYALSDRA